MNWKFWQKEKEKPVVVKSKAREWIDAIVFAVVAASLIRIFIFEAYTIPTESMEKSLMVGDFLFVSKISYGARIPMTPLAFPFAHHTMPLLGTKAYSELIKWSYKRLPGLGNIKRNDVVVFNYPMEYSIGRPVDKRENYIKRCVGIPGDTLKLINGDLHINSNIAYRAEDVQMEYLVKTNGTFIDPEVLEEMDITEGGLAGNDYVLFTTKKNADQLKSFSNILSITPRIHANGEDGILFPDTLMLHQNSIDNFGPIWIPKKGSTVTLDSANIDLYRKIIAIYEGHSLTCDKNGIVIDGQKTTTYTFKYNYYWMMGDNRHNSLDSRFWGFVPEDHIVGKAWMVWLSINYGTSNWLKKIRWNRFFMLIH